MSLPWAVIIAGGQGQRLGGVRKADLRIGGVGLLDRVVTSLGPVQHPLLISTGPDDLKVRLPPDSVAIPDLDATCPGPLAALVAAVDALQKRGVNKGTLISVAVDTPFLPRDFVARMIAALGDAPAAFAAWGNDFYPPNAAWNLSALTDSRANLASRDSPNSLKSLQIALKAQRVDWFVSGGKNPFANLNTLSNLVELGVRAVSACGE
ncbi:molybdenum cofactor guanylyltransferase [Devosia epidermidihirudinis]|uniref:molybdenum cofactor guanylyltransferase n=1 Tax=Devosia epidermidihirudinis TaxID=1293439 RepID=UPI000696E461|nr:NTP transferase domain-containing protein [Devosia epidermidihirudinis]